MRQNSESCFVRSFIIVVAGLLFAGLSFAVLASGYFCASSYIYAILIFLGAAMLLGLLFSTLLARRSAELKAAYCCCGNLAAVGGPPAPCSPGCSSPSMRTAVRSSPVSGSAPPSSFSSWQLPVSSAICAPMRAATARAVAARAAAGARAAVTVRDTAPAPASGESRSAEHPLSPFKTTCEKRIHAAKKRLLRRFFCAHRLPAVYFAPTRPRLMERSAPHGRST